ncbi:hypothetical protein J6590_057671 [Homalodisca vitripennis]|nr:hypothetical protein J6590_057671 [Homalodisca vitripennis]
MRWISFIIDVKVMQHENNKELILLREYEYIEVPDHKGISGKETVDTPTQIGSEDSLLQQYSSSKYLRKRKLDQRLRDMALFKASESYKDGFKPTDECRLCREAEESEEQIWLN